MLNKADEKEEEKESNEEWQVDHSVRAKEESIKGEAEMAIKKINPIFFGTRHLETQMRHGVVREVYP